MCACECVCSDHVCVPVAATEAARPPGIPTYIQTMATLRRWVEEQWEGESQARQAEMKGVVSMKVVLDRVRELLEQAWKEFAR